MTLERQDTTVAWIAAGIAFGVTLLVYVCTLSPTVTLEASGQLVVAANHLGVARPPGYPVWTLLARGFIALFPFATYQGHPNPAWAVNFMSAVFGALACGLLAGLVSRGSQQLFPEPRSAPARICAGAGIAAALLFAFSPVLWSQAVIAETHTLTNFFLLLLLALALRWISTGDNRSAYLLAFLFGLGLSISQLLILFAPVLLLAAAFVSRKALARLTPAVALFLGFLFAEFLWGKTKPVYGAAALGTLLAIALLLAVFRRTRPTAFLLILLLAGLLPYAYLPLAAAHHPPMNMGQACTWQGFWHVLGRGQYEALVLSNPFAAPLKFAHQLAWHFRLAASQFTAPLAILALVPIFSLPWLNRPARRSLALVLVAFFCFAIVLVIGVNPQLDIQNTFIARVVFIPSFALLALLIGIGLAILMDGMGARKIWRNPKPRPIPYSPTSNRAGLPS